MDKIELYVCIPSGGTWMSRFGRSLALMTSFFSTVRVFENVFQRLYLTTVESSMLCANREHLVKTALQNNATHILFLDSDMQFPIDTAHRLLRREKDFICAAYTTRTEPALPIAVDANGKKFLSTKRCGVQKIQHAGLGCCLIKADLIKKLTPPLFLMDWIPAQFDGVGRYCGEDVYFSQKLAEIGVDLWVDHDLSKEIGHVGHKVYTCNDVDLSKLSVHNAGLKTAGE